MSIKLLVKFLDLTVLHFSLMNSLIVLMPLRNYSLSHFSFVYFDQLTHPSLSAVYYHLGLPVEQQHVCVCIDCS